MKKSILTLSLLITLYLSGCSNQIDTTVKTTTRNESNFEYSLKDIFISDNDLKNTTIWYRTNYTNSEVLESALIDYIYIIDNENHKNNKVIKYNSNRTTGDLFTVSNPLEMIVGDIKDGIAKSAKLRKNKEFNLLFAKEESTQVLGRDYFILESITDGSFSVEPLYLSREFGKYGDTINNKKIKGFYAVAPNSEKDQNSAIYLFTNYFTGNEQLILDSNDFPKNDIEEINRRGSIN